MDCSESFPNVASNETVADFSAVEFLPSVSEWSQVNGQAQTQVSMFFDEPFHIQIEAGGGPPQQLRCDTSCWEESCCHLFPWNLTGVP